MAIYRELSRPSDTIYRGYLAIDGMIYYSNQILYQQNTISYNYKDQDFIAESTKDLGITIAICFKKSEYDKICEIHETLMTPGNLVLAKVSVVEPSVFKGVGLFYVTSIDLKNLTPWLEADDWDFEIKSHLTKIHFRRII